MTKIEKAREIIRQNGECNGFMCDSYGENKCPCWDVCTSIGNGSTEERVCACKSFLEELKECLTDGVYENGKLVNQPREKTLLDEFAIAAMERIIAKRPYMIAHSDDELAMANHIVRADCRGAYSYAAAMMAERARRDEMGNIKEV